MKPSIFREITLYRYRYIIGYGLFALVVIILLVLEIGRIPRGLADGEMVSSVTSNHISLANITPSNVIDAPYHFLQKLSLLAFGLTPFAIKLPSLILGFLLAFLLALSLRQWFSHNVAVVAALIAASSAPFMAMGRLGMPLIMVSFWTVCLLFGGINLVIQQKHTFIWKLFCMICAVLLMYSPFGIYPLVALVIAGIIHPHIRHQLRRTKVWQLLILIFVGIIFLIPLVLASIKQPSVLLTLLGVDILPHGFTDLKDNLVTIYNLFFNFGGNTVGITLMPMFNVVTLVLILLGFLRLCRDYFTARSYLLSAWLAIVIIILILNPDAIQLIFTPLVLLLAIGVETLIRQWYQLFPRNPYARIGALVPLIILVLGIATANIGRYLYTYGYTTYSGFSQGLPTVRKALDAAGPNTPIALVTNQDQAGFYDILRREYPQLHVTPALPTTQDGKLFVLNNSNVRIGTPPDFIYTSSLKNDPVILRSYR